MTNPHDQWIRVYLGVVKVIRGSAIDIEMIKLLDEISLGCVCGYWSCPTRSAPTLWDVAYSVTLQSVYSSWLG